MEEYIEKIKVAILPKKKDKEKIQMTPRRDWRRVVALFFILTFLLSGGTFYAFYLLNKWEVSAPGQGTGLPIETIDRGSMLKTIDAFDGKEAALADLLSKKPRKIDPSR